LPCAGIARGPEIPDPGYRVTELGGGAYGITSGLVNTMFLVTQKGVVVVDAPPDLGGKLLIGIEDVTPNLVTHLIYSHAHADHIGSAHLLARDGVTIIGHQLTARLLKDANDDNRPLPNETFGGTRSELRIDGNRLILEYTGDWHQAGNLFIHLPDQKILTAIDSFTVKNAPFFRLLFSAHVPAYFAAMDQILEHDFQTVVSGHMALFGTADQSRVHPRPASLRDRGDAHGGPEGGRCRSRRAG
jgi:glyoxylase-like metal-dependent hydrolase (beta-lactamase superfamily II)